MNEPEPSREKRDERADDETPGRWLLGCFLKTLVVFVVLVLLVFGACFLLLNTM